MTSSADLSNSDLREAHRRLREFRRGHTDERLFIHPTCHPAEPTGFCYCEGSWWRAGRFYAQALLTALVFKLPFNGLARPVPDRWPPLTAETASRKWWAPGFR